MIKALTNWLENRTGIGAITKEALFERVPGGARWRYVWGSCLTFAFFAFTMYRKATKRFRKNINWSPLLCISMASEFAHLANAPILQLSAAGGSVI